MKWYLPVLLIFAGNMNMVSAALNPIYKQALQRGFAVEGDSVLLPDGSKCLLEDFNNQKCGKEFFDQPYCVEEGNYVWDDNACCDGLVPYLPSGIDGQTTCQKKGKVDFSEILRNPLLWLGILAFTGIIFFSLILLKKFIKK